MTIHIISRKNKWAIKKEGISRATKLYEWRDQAYREAVSIANKTIVHNKDGYVDFITINDRK